MTSQVVEEVATGVEDKNVNGRGICGEITSRGLRRGPSE